MDKKKRWQFVLILTVILLTIYNILPTILYYAKPLDQPIGQKQAHAIASSIIKRVNNLEPQSIAWVRSYNRLLHIKKANISIDPDNAQLIHIHFQNEQDAALFKKHLPRAGALIPFAPAQLQLVSSGNMDSTYVTVQRNLPIQFQKEDPEKYFHFAYKKQDHGQPTEEYQSVIHDRVKALVFDMGGTTENARYVDLILQEPTSFKAEEFLETLTQQILTYTQVFGKDHPLAKRFYATFTQGEFEQKHQMIDQLIQIFTSYYDNVKSERITLSEKEEKLHLENSYLDVEEKGQLQALANKEQKLGDALAILKKYRSSFASGATPFQLSTLEKQLESFEQGQEELLIGSHNPLIDKVRIDWNGNSIQLLLHPEMLAFQKKLELEGASSTQRELFQRLIYNQIAQLARNSDETITPDKQNYSIAFSTLEDSNSFLTLNLKAIAKQRVFQLKDLLENKWVRTHPDLISEHFPIWDYETYQSLPAHQKKLGLLIYAPTIEEETLSNHFHNDSIYVIAKGIENILQKLQSNPSSQEAKLFMKDFESLKDLLQANGFYGFHGNIYPFRTHFKEDFIFEGGEFYQTLLAATRENFNTYGTKSYAILDFSNVKERIYTLNRIETGEHEDLLKWRDDYESAQTNPRLEAKYDIPKPTKNPLWNNLKLSTDKYFRGDERKILNWGLDLSGGKTVQIQLKNRNGTTVTDSSDLRQAINELYLRVNKLGVSEVSIRQEGNNITLDFPSAQGISASELIKASSMQFHVVNEKFTSQNATLASDVQQFLQEIWNEAVVTNRKDLESINAIAWKHLYGDVEDADYATPSTITAQRLYDAGLRLANPQSSPESSAFNDVLSKIAIYRGSSFTDWQGQTHPLLLVMNNFALEGANLENVHASYDPSKGNYLSFEVKNSYRNSEGQKIHPRNDLYIWTNAFSKEKVSEADFGKYTQGEGWRMAVILNGSIISTPRLESPLRDRVMITGNFTQREANKLEADLKAGSLSFTPHILSEKNISPDLGLKDRQMGILATIVALILVIALMVSYYRFAGIVASVAVLFNLLIMWATLQNIQAALTLAGIAGVILTVGMAVDANVLVFERIREEFLKSGKITQAVRAGYKKAFSAIFDSNLTTIIAALILLHFDSGPIKGFAITLIIGIVSSLFTALFMTRYFFMHWIENPNHKNLKMASFLKNPTFNFLKYGKVAFLGVGIIAILGCSLLFISRHTIFGMDFTGGYSLNLEVAPKQAHTEYQQAVEKALYQHGLTAQEVQVRQLSPETHVKILLSRTMDEPNHPFYHMPIETNEENPSYAYENNPRISWIVNALAQEGITLTEHSLETLDQDWTLISGQMSDAMKKNASIGLMIALLSILVYITIRFEFKYAISATLGLAIDVIFTLATIAILHELSVPIQIDLNTIAALMTIIGYSLNDTIIIFDRIREDLKSMRKHSYKEIVNHALNVTLSRTLMTSGTTLIVLIALVALGGSAIFGLSLVMTIGVIFGTFSSLFIAAPLLLMFHQREQKKEKQLTPSGK